MFSWYPPEMGKYFATAFRRIYARYRSEVRAHSQAISRTLYRGRTVVPRGHRALRQDTQGAHLPGWLVSPLRWAALPRLRLCLRHPALLDLLPVGLVPQPYTRNWTQPYTRNLTRLYTRNQLSHTRELNSAIHANSTQPYTRSVSQPYTRQDNVLAIASMSTCLQCVTITIWADDLECMHVQR